MRRVAAVALAAACALSASCSGNPEPILVPPRPAASASAAAPAASSAPGDPMATRPEVAEAPAFVPPAPEVFAGPGGSKVWLLERHTLPLVSVVAVVAVGGADEPADRPGLAHITADMLDEGGDKLDAVAFSKALEELGAQLSSTADREKSAVSLQALSSKLSEALALMGSAIARPRHAEADWKRVSSLWKNALKARADDPSDLARLVTSAALWGADHPYGRPLEGTQASARAIALGDISGWHQKLWQPANVTFVVVGDVSKGRISDELNKAFPSWVAGPAKSAALPPAALPAPAAAPRTVLVDRHEAPQVVVSVVRRSVNAASGELPRLDLMNIALGGSFTSRLNQNLREDHGWTYGARSRFSAMRQGGVFLARASIRTDALTEALKETLSELRKMAEQGPTDDEVAKTKALARADAVDTYSSLQAIAASLAANVALGLPPDHDARTLASQTSATRADLVPMAKKAFVTDDATVVMVGPRKAIEAALQANGLPTPEERDTEGRPVNAGKAPKKAAE